MFSDAMTTRVMANKYRRLAEQQTGPNERDRYRAYARIYSEMALRFELQNELAGLSARKQARVVH
jgi:hypothetical protein